MVLIRMIAAKQDGHFAARDENGKKWEKIAKMAKMGDLQPGLHFLSL